MLNFKKIIPLITLLFSCSLQANQDNYNFEIELSKTFSDASETYNSGSDRFGYNNYSNEYYSISDIHSFSFKFTHPHGPLPLIKLEHSTMRGDQNFTKLNNSFNSEQSSSFATSHNARHSDLTLFYKLIDKRFDLLLGASYVKTSGGSTVNNLNTLENTHYNLNDSFPTLYVGTEIDISSKWKLYLDVDFFFELIVGDQTYMDANIRTEYQFDSGVSIGLGYRHDNLLDFVERNHNIYGLYEGVFTNLKYYF